MKKKKLVAGYRSRGLGTSDEKFHALARYNSEVARGIVHTPEWDERMRDLQSEWNAAWSTEHPGMILVDRGEHFLGVQDIP